jgi:hypothetical protein
VRTAFRRLGTTVAAVVVCVLLPASSAANAALVLREADLDITVTSPTACEVTMTLTVEGARETDHRVQTFDGGRTDLVDLWGASPVGDVRSIGRTQSLMLRPDQATYGFRYRVKQPDALAGRCPIWLPAAATDGRSRAVSIRIQLPRGSTPGRSMPPFDWAGALGSTRLGHLPAFVRVHYATEGESPGWDNGRAMEAVAVLVFGAATAIWAWRRRG